MGEAVCARPGIFDPHSAFYRWSIMAGTGLMLFGSYFAYDSIAAISQLLTSQEGYTPTQVGMMDSIYSWPNIVMVLFAGILIDKLGTRMMSLILSALVILSTVIVAMAPSFTVLLIGRAALGVGAESLSICQGVILTKWFKDKELTLAFALALVLVRLGSFASLNLEAAVANRYGGIGAALWFATIMCVVSLIFAIYYVVMEKAAEGKLQLVPRRKKMDRKKIKKLDSRFWYITILCVAFYGAIYPFRSLAQDFFFAKWGILPETGGRIIGILVYCSMILALPIGWVVDKIGKRGTLLLLGTLLMIPAHLSMGLGDLHPVYPMILLGLSFALVSTVLWPTVPLIVGKETAGTAFGLIVMIQNIGLATLPVLNGVLRDDTGSYVSSQMMFVGLGVIALIFATLLFISDRKKGSVLERKTMREAVTSSSAASPSSNLAQRDGADEPQRRPGV